MRPTREMASRPVSPKPLWMLSLILLVQFSACAVQTRTEDDDTTNTFVRIVDMRAGNTDMGEDVFSDVCDLDATTLACTITNDNAEVEMSAQPKDLAQLQSPVQDIIFNRYRVTYIRADGRNVPGVDVPYPFDGAINFRVPVDGTGVTRVFMVVRQQAKLESPLKDMTGGGGAQVLSVIARVDFFGVDVAGRNLQVTGTLNITFADFADN
jgi:hypothetical protein